MPRIANYHHVLFALAGLFLVQLPASGSNAEDEHLGEIEYEIACLPCHGMQGKGNGPLARNLTPAPSDLTQITTSNKGIFPFNRVLEVIDGREQVTAHGTRSMPVWGDRYRVHAEPDENRTLVERRARNRIRALAQYVESLQEK